MVMLNLRPYQPSDYDAVWHLHVLALQQVGAYAGDGPWDDDLRHIETAYGSDRAIFLVGTLGRTEGDRLIAMGALKPTAEGSIFPLGWHHAEITRMRVDLEFQGQGLGQHLLETLEAKAQQFGYTTLHLETSIHQAAAQHLYRKNGFREVRQIRLKGLDCLMFEKQMD